jgi:DNA-binding NtrC family response regulator
MIYNILVVDDDAIQANIAGKVIKEKMHCQTRIAHNGNEAIEVLTHNNEIDLVVLDLAMPGMNGIEVLQTMRPLKPNLPFIIRSGFEDVSMVAEAMKAGAVDYISKVDNISSLCASIERVLPRPYEILKNESTPTLEQVEALLHQHTENILNLEDPKGNFKTLTDIEREVILHALKRYHYHMSKVAKHLGIGRSTLYRKLDEYKIHPDHNEYDA